MHNMTNDQLVLQVNKINISPDKTYVKYNQNERGKVLDVTVIDNDGINAYDLTNKKIRFVDNKEDNKLVLDDEADNPGHFTRTADAQGKFSYTFHDLVYQRSGIARFEIYTDADHIDATANFEIQIETTSSLSAANESYISSLEGLVAHYRSTVDTTVSENKQLINELTNRINQSISKSQNDFSSKLSDWQNDYNAWKAEKETDLTAQLKSITDQIDSDKSTTNQIHNELVDIQGQIEAVKKNLSSIDFTKFVTQDQLKTNLDKINQELGTKANTQDVTTNAQRIAALENAGYIKGKFDGFASADEAKQWSKQNHGIAIFNDETDQTTN